MKDLCIVYINAKGDVKSYELDMVSDSGNYLQAIHDGKLKTFRKDRVVWSGFDSAMADSIISESTAELLSQPTNPEPRKQGLEVCFTGFAKQAKSDLIDRATTMNCIVRQSVTAQLDILCYGYNAGPAKMNAAREKGILILDESEFSTLLETGEIPFES